MENSAWWDYMNVDNETQILNQCHPPEYARLSDLNARLAEIFQLYEQVVCSFRIRVMTLRTKSSAIECVWSRFDVLFFFFCTPACPLLIILPILTLTTSITTFLFKNHKVGDVWWNNERQYEGSILMKQMNDDPEQRSWGISPSMRGISLLNNTVAVVIVAAIEYCEHQCQSHLLYCSSWADWNEEPITVAIVDAQQVAVSAVVEV